MKLYSEFLKILADKIYEIVNRDDLSSFEIANALLVLANFAKKSAIIIAKSEFDEDDEDKRIYYLVTFKGGIEALFDAGNYIKMLDSELAKHIESYVSVDGLLKLEKEEENIFKKEDEDDEVW